MAYFNIRYGTEGPKNDPYSFTEYFCNGWTLHTGLQIFIIEEDGERTDPEFGSKYEESALELIQKFELHSNMSCNNMESENDKYEPDPMGCLADYI